MVLKHAEPEAPSLLISTSLSIRLRECPLMGEYVFVFLQCCGFETQSGKQLYDITRLFSEELAESEMYLTICE